MSHHPIRIRLIVSPVDAAGTPFRTQARVVRCVAPSADVVLVQGWGAGAAEAVARARAALAYRRSLKP